MNQQEFEQLQEAFLNLVDSPEAERESMLQELNAQSSEIALQVRRMLASISEPSIFDRPLVRHPERDDSSTDNFTPSQSEHEFSDQIDGFRILQRIGEGGHGIVFMAEQLQPIRRRVAIKCVKPGMDSARVLARFEAERQALAMMSHPSIANVLDAGVSETGQPYFVMELVHGMPIDDFCRRNELSLRERLSLIQQVCSAVHHAHRKGIIHRDIKPANVLVTLDEGKPLAKVIDFGIAKALCQPLTDLTLFTEFGQIIGTLEYMSPEQSTMSQTEVDVRSDVYALGVLMYLLITGETPLSKDELLKRGIWELKNILQTTEPAAPSSRITRRTSARNWRSEDDLHATWIRSIRGDLDWITLKALAKSPDQRYDSARALSDDVGNYLSGVAISARPPSTWYRCSKWIVRHRSTSLAVAALGSALIIAFLGMTWGYFQSQSNLRALTKSNRQIVRYSDQLSEEKLRADEAVERMAGLLKQEMLEGAWIAAMDGDHSVGMAMLDQIPQSLKSFESRWIAEVSKQSALLAMRSPSRGPIRATDVGNQGTQMVMISSDSKLEVWLELADSPSFVVSLPPQMYTAVALSVDDHLVLAGTSSGEVVLIDLVKQQLANQFTLGKGAIRDLTYDSNHKHWVASTGANSICILHSTTLELLNDRRLSQRLNELALSGDGTQIALITMERQMVIVDAQNLTICQTLESLPNDIIAASWIDGNLVVADESGTFFCFESLKQSAEHQDSIMLSPLPDSTRYAAFNRPIIRMTQSNEGIIIAACRGGELLTCDLQSRRIATVRKFSSAIRFVNYFGTRGDVVVAQESGRTSLVLAEEIERALNLSLLVDEVTDGVEIEEKNRLLTSHSDGIVRDWRSSDGTIAQEWQSHTGTIYGLQISPNSNRMASVGSDQKIVLSNLATLDPIAQWECGWGVRSLAFSSDGRRLAGPPPRSESNQLVEGTIAIWDIQASQPITYLEGHSNWVLELQFTKNNEHLVTLSVDGTVKFWNVGSGQCHTTIAWSDLAQARTMTLLPDQRVVVGHEDGTICAYDLESGELIEKAELAGDAITGIVAAKSESVIVASVRDFGELMLLNSSDLSLIARLDCGIGPISGIRSDPTGQRLLVLGESGAVRSWPFDP